LGEVLQKSSKYKSLEEKKTEKKEKKKQQKSNSAIDSSKSVFKKRRIK